MKTKPFDMEAALAGAPVVTRDGRRVINLQFAKTYPIEATIVNDDETTFHDIFTKDGCIWDNGLQSDFDLFMLDEEGRRGMKTKHFNYEEARAGARLTDGYGHDIKVIAWDLRDHTNALRSFTVLVHGYSKWVQDGKPVTREYEYSVDYFSNGVRKTIFNECQLEEDDKLLDLLIVVDGEEGGEE